MVAAIERGGRPTQAEFHAAIANRSDRWFSACLRITRSAELAEDAVQEALLSAWHKRDQFQRSASLETWIHRIAVNAALQLIRKQRPDRFEALEAEPADDADSPEQEMSNRDVGRSLKAALARLSDIERICFVLKHLEQWRLSEIAEELETNVGTVKQAIFRAVRKLRASMGNIRSI